MRDFMDLRELGFLIHYDTPRGTCIDIQFGRDLFEAVSRFRLGGIRRPSSIQSIRPIFTIEF